MKATLSDVLNSAGGRDAAGVREVVFSQLDQVFYIQLRNGDKVCVTRDMADKPVEDALGDLFFALQDGNSFARWLLLRAAGE